MLFKDSLRKPALLLMTAFTVFSCITVDKSLGEQYVPEDHDLVVKTVSLKLPVTLKSEDSLQGVSSDYATVGAIRTSQFGLAGFGVSANICPPTRSFKFGKDPVIKYIYLSAPVKSSLVIDDSQTAIPQDIFVHRLKKRLDSTTVYCNSVTSADYDPVPLNLSSATYFGGDTIKVYLKNEYGTELLSAKPEELDSLDLFINRFKGLYVRSSAPEGNLDGGRMSHIQRSSAAIVMKYNFQPEWKEGLERKDTIVYMSFGDGYCLNTSEYGSANLETDQPLDILPVEGVAGVKPYVDAKALKSIIDAWVKENGYDNKKIIVSKALFSFPFEVPGNFDMTKYPQYLFPTQRYANTIKSEDGKDINQKYYYLFDDVNTPGNNLGAINRSLCEYYGDISPMIQKMINKDASEINGRYNFWLAPLQSIKNQYNGTVSYHPDVYNYYVGKINGPEAVRYPELKILFAVFK